MVVPISDRIAYENFYNPKAERAANDFLVQLETIPVDRLQDDYCGTESTSEQYSTFLASDIGQQLFKMLA